MAREEISGKITHVTRMGEDYMVNLDSAPQMAVGLHRDGAPPHRGQHVTVRGESVSRLGGRVEEIDLDGVPQWTPWDEYKYQHAQGTPGTEDRPDWT